MGLEASTLNKAVSRAGSFKAMLTPLILRL